MTTTAPSNKHFKRGLKAGFYLHLDQKRDFWLPLICTRAKKPNGVFNSI